METLTQKISIIGTGGFAREIVCLLKDLNRYDDILCFYEVDSIWESNWKGKKIMGIPVRPQSEFDYNMSSIVVGIGDSKIREKVVKQLPKDTIFETLIHPTSIVSEWCTLGKGTIICAGCILTCNIELGEHTQLNLQTTIGHDCKIGSYFTSAPGTNISGICEIGNHVYFGTSSAVRQGIKICDNVIIGMGAMVVKSIEEAGVYTGIPAKKIK